MPLHSALIKMTGPAALHTLARAFANFNEFDRFVQGLQAALNHSEHFDRLTIHIDRALADAPPAFSAGALTLPLTGEAKQLGTLQVAPAAGTRQFGPEDLHLMAGLADFLSATLTQALRLQTAAKSRELLRFLLNQAPVGIAAYAADKSKIVANDLAERWLGEGGVPFDQLANGSGGFHLRAGGKLIYGEARRLAGEAGDAWIVVLQDLTSEQGRLLELLQRETYRALVENRRMSFAFIEGAQVRAGVLRRLPELRAALLPGETAGPYDAHRLGVVFPNLDGLALRARLRKLRGVFAAADGLQLGYAELSRDGPTPERLLDVALQRHGAYDEMLRPALLVHDDNSAVADTFAMVLGREYRVVKSTVPARTRELLAQEVFEGFVTELELRNGVSGVELARFAREQRPGIRSFFTTVQEAPFVLPAGVTAADAVMLGKPFDVAALTQTVRAKLAEP
jgi:hypothetical protein